MNMLMRTIWYFLGSLNKCVLPWMHTSRKLKTKQRTNKQTKNGTDFWRILLSKLCIQKEVRSLATPTRSRSLTAPSCGYRKKNTNNTTTTNNRNKHHPVHLKFVQATQTPILPWCLYIFRTEQLYTLGQDREMIRRGHKQGVFFFSFHKIVDSVIEWWLIIETNYPIFPFGF